MRTGILFGGGKEGPRESSGMLVMPPLLVCTVTAWLCSLGKIPL